MLGPIIVFIVVIAAVEVAEMKKRAATEFAPQSAARLDITSVDNGMITRPRPIVKNNPLMACSSGGKEDWFTPALPGMEDMTRDDDPCESEPVPEGHEDTPVTEDDPDTPDMFPGFYTNARAVLGHNTEEMVRKYEALKEARR